MIDIDIIVPVTHVKIAGQRVQDLLVSAFEGGSNDWYSDLTPHYPKKQSVLDFWHCDLPLIPGGYVTLEAVGADKDPHKVFRIDIKTITAGLQRMAEKDPKAFSDFMDEADDAITADVFLQYVCFGEVIFS